MTQIIDNWLIYLQWLCLRRIFLFADFFFLSRFDPPVICCVYVSADSYLSVHTHPSLEAHELLKIVSLKLDRAEEEMVLAVMSQTGGICRECLYDTRCCQWRFSHFLLTLFTLYSRGSLPFCIPALLTSFLPFSFPHLSLKSGDCCNAATVCTLSP